MKDDPSGERGVFRIDLERALGGVPSPCYSICKSVISINPHLYSFTSAPNPVPFVRALSTRASVDNIGFAPCDILQG